MRRSLRLPNCSRVLAQFTTTTEDIPPRQNEDIWIVSWSGTGVLFRNAKFGV